MTRIFLNDDVLTAARQRIGRLFDEFDTVVVNISGGKDSTVVYNLTLEEAERRGRLPVPVMFLDQEAEWQSVIDYIRVCMHDPRVQPYWLQIPIRLFNATTGDDPWLYCWRAGDDWIREREPDSIHENILGTDRFHKGFRAFTQAYFPDRRVAQIAGVRCEESPARMSGLTAYATYKDITWGSVIDKARDHYNFYPLYDWSYTDVWKAIHEHQWAYCRLYDWMYQYGIPVQKMRVSNVHHETAVHSLTFLQEIEPDTWERITRRVGGVNTVNQLPEAYQTPRTLPPMFADWYEYRDYLLEKLIGDPEKRAAFRRSFATLDKGYVPELWHKVVAVEIGSILINDFEGTRISSFVAAHGKYARNAGKLAKQQWDAFRAEQEEADGAKGAG